MTKTLARAAPRKGFWVAVLPFKYTGGSADLTALAEGDRGDRHRTVALLIPSGDCPWGSTPRMLGKLVAMFLFPIGPSSTKRKISYQIALHFATRREPYLAGSFGMARIAFPPA